MFAESSRPAGGEIAHMTGKALFLAMNRLDMFLKPFFVSRHVRAELALKFLEENNEYSLF